MILFSLRASQSFLHSHTFPSDSNSQIFVSSAHITFIQNSIPGAYIGLFPCKIEVYNLVAGSKRELLAGNSSLNPLRRRADDLLQLQLSLHYFSGAV
jgi:hypothetical protein